MAYIAATEQTVSEVISTSFQPLLAQHVTDDLLLVCLTQDTGATAINTVTPGWLLIGTQLAFGSSRQVWYYKIATSSSELDPTFTGSNEEWIAFAFTVKDVDTVTPIHDSARSNWNNPASGVIPSASLTTTNDNCLVFYSWGTDGTAPLITPPSDMMAEGRVLNVGVRAIVGWRNQYSAGAIPSVVCQHQISIEGGNTWAIAINNAVGGSIAAEVRPACDVIRYYGGGNWEGSWSALSSLAASINGVTCSATAPAIATVGNPNSLWGSATQVGTSTTTVPSFEGGVDTFPAVDMTGKLLTFLVNMATTTSPLRWGPFGIGLIIGDVAGNWVAYRIIPRANLRVAVYTLAMVPGEGELFDSSGTLDLTQINRIGLFSERTASTNAQALYGIKYLMLQSGASLIGGSPSNPGRVASLNQALNTGWEIFGACSLQGAAQLLARQSLQLGDGTTPTHVSLSASSIELPNVQSSILRPINGQNFLPKDNNLSFTIRASAADTINLASSIVATSSPQNFLIHASSSPSADYDFTGCSILGWAVTNNVAGIVFNSATFNGTRGITLNGGGMNGCIIVDSANSPAVTTNDPEQIVDCNFTSLGTGHAIEITVPGTYNFTGNSFAGYGANGTTNAAIYNNSGGLVTLALAAGNPTPTVRNGAGASTVISSVPVAVNATVLANSRIQLFNVTTATEIENVFQAGTSYEFVIDGEATSGDVLRFRVTKLGFSAVESAATFTGASINFIVPQTADEVYDTYALDGSAMTGFAANYGNTTVERTNASNFTGASFYAWWNHNLTTENGIRNFYGGLTAIDSANLRINNSVVNLHFDITGTANVFQSDNIRIFRADEGYPVDNPTTGGGAIDLNWRNVVYTIAVGSGVTAGDKTDIRDLILADPKFLSVPKFLGLK